MGVHVLDWMQEWEVNYRPQLEPRLKGARGMRMWVGRTTKGEDMGLE